MFPKRFDKTYTKTFTKRFAKISDRYYQNILIAMYKIDLSPDTYLKIISSLSRQLKKYPHLTNPPPPCISNDLPHVCSQLGETCYTCHECVDFFTKIVQFLHNTCRIWTDVKGKS